MEVKVINNIDIALITYDVRLVVLSLVIAVIGSYTSLALTGQVPIAQPRGRLAMTAVSFYPTDQLEVWSSSAMDSFQLAIAIGVAGLIILMLAFLASCFGRRLWVEAGRAEVLRESGEQYQNLYDLAPVAYFTIAADGTLKSVNQFGAEYLRYRKEELIGKSLWSYIYEVERELFQQWVTKIFNEKLVISEIELRQVRKDGSVLWVRQHSQLLFGKGGIPIELRLICIDITERKQVEEQLLYNAFHDALTGLPNRALFMNRLRQVIEHAKRHKDYLFAVLFLDLDRFKVINDSLGHIIGDQLLIGIAGKLKAGLRPTDTVARLGGDEFTILLEDIEDVSDALRVADRIQAELTLPFALYGQEVFTSISIGIALSATDYDQPADFLRDADIAMYRAKSQGSSRYEIFNRNMHAQAVARLQLETDLRNAFERQEFRLQYQPIVLLETGMLIGFEALLRWQHPQHGLQKPAAFILAAEETGLLTRITQWVLRIACCQLRTWQLQIPGTPPLSISVNLSGQQFTQANLIDQISQVLQETDLEPYSLRLEITEGVIMESAESVIAKLLQLRDLGVQLSIDDFGTGYSSLGRLHHFPINGLKIDRSFVSHMSSDEGNSEIVETIVTLAYKLGVDVTAEGIETAEQLAQLRALKCKYGQGYFFSKPLDSEAVEALIMANMQ